MEDWTTRELDPDERAFVRQFEGSECLYRDALNRRILADVEGSGVWKAEGNIPVLPVVDGVEGANNSPVFTKSVRVVAEHDGKVCVCVQTDSSDVRGPLRTVALPHEGSGWLVSAGGTVYLDGNADSVVFWPGVPLPFFLGIEGTGTASIIAAPGIWERVPLSMDLRGASRPHGENGCRSVLNELNLSVHVPRGGAPLRLIRSYDRFHGRQRARVFVNGEPVGWWRDDTEDRVKRIATSAVGFFVPEGRLYIRLLPQPGTALWSFGVIQALVGMAFPTEIRANPAILRCHT